MTECFENSGGSAAAATYIIVNPHYRGRQWGRHLMALIEQRAVKLGYHYVYLWTHTAIPFYKKLGYRECERVSLHRACLKTLETQQVDQLESLLFNHQKKLLSKQHTNEDGLDTSVGKHKRSSPSKSETVLLPPTSNSDGDKVHEGDVWMRKRLVETLDSIRFDKQTRISEVQAALQSEGSYSTCCWEYRLVNLPWQQQIGPSCGLAALRMLYEHYHGQPSPRGGRENDGGEASLLDYARQRGYTADGEIFDANHLLDTAVSACSLDCSMYSCTQTSNEDILDLLGNGGTAVLPYDSIPTTNRPGKSCGHHAHWGIIVGVLLGFAETTQFSSIANNNEVTMKPFKGQSLPSGASATLLIVQHSLSRSLSVAPWQAFWESNAQLGLIDQRRFSTVKSLDLADRLLFVHGAAHTCS